MRLLLCAITCVFLLVSQTCAVTSPSSEATRHIQDAFRQVKTAVRATTPVLTMDNDITLTKEMCDALGREPSFACMQPLCYAMVDCPTTITSMSALNMSTVTNQQLTNLCSGSCFSRILTAVKDFFVKCNSGSSAGLNPSMFDSVAKFTCSRHPDGDFCYYKLRMVNDQDHTLTNSSALNGLTSTAPFCVRMGSMGCCVTSILDMITATGGDQTVRLQINTALNLCSIPTSPACVGAAGTGTKQAVSFVIRINGYSIVKYQALSAFLQESFRVSFRKDIANWLVQRGLSGITFQNIFTVNVQGTASYVEVRTQIFGTSDAQTQQATSALQSSLAAARSNPSVGPSFPLTQAAADVLSTTSAAVSVDYNASSASQVTLGSDSTSSGVMTMNYASMLTFLVVVLATILLF